MSFEYVQDDEPKAREILSRVVGSIFSLNGKFAIDREADAVVVNLGGQPEREPGNTEGPPGFYNLHWAGDVFAADGHTQFHKDGASYVKIFTVRVTAPRSAESRIEEARKLMELGLTVIESACYRTEINARLIFSEIIYR